MSLIDVKVPDIGDFKDIGVIEILVRVGDSVQKDQSLITVESDKAAMEIPSSAAGVVRELHLNIGDKVSQGALILRVEPAAASIAPAAVAAHAAPLTAPAPPSATAVPALKITQPAAGAAFAPHTPATPQDPSGLLHASPAVRKSAREMGIPLAEVQGSGAAGRITLEDLQNFSRAVMAGARSTLAQHAAGAASSAPTHANAGSAALALLPWPQIDFTKFGPIERVPLGRIRKISSANLLRNHVMIAAVTNHDDADISELEALRVQLNRENAKDSSKPKLTLLAFLIKASVAALKQFPDFNSSLEGEYLVRKNYWHIGFAADTPNGLMVPVIRDADQKGIYALSAEMAQLAGLAREGKLSPTQMQGASFTISSLGGIGGRYFTPIINAPEVAILGVCKSRTEPLWDGQAFQPRLMLPLSLTWDHRVIDGAAAARFNAYLGQVLADMRRVLL